MRKELLKWARKDSSFRAHLISKLGRNSFSKHSPHAYRESIKELEGDFSRGGKGVRDKADDLYKSLINDERRSRSEDREEVDDLLNRLEKLREKL